LPRGIILRSDLPLVKRGAALRLGSPRVLARSPEEIPINLDDSAS